MRSFKFDMSTFVEEEKMNIPLHAQYSLTYYSEKSNSVYFVENDGNGDQIYNLSINSGIIEKKPIIFMPLMIFLNGKKSCILLE